MFKPLGFRVLVLPDTAKDKLEPNMIEIPEAVLHKQRLDVDTGVVVGIGDQSWKDIGNGEPWAKVGDHILYSKYGGKLIKDPESGIEYVVLNDKDVLGLI
jgi:co-chaperonin GroES (HSP10)